MFSFQGLLLKSMHWMKYQFSRPSSSLHHGSQPGSLWPLVKPRFPPTSCLHPAEWKWWDTLKHLGCCHLKSMTTDPGAPGRLPQPPPPPTFCSRRQLFHFTMLHFSNLQPSHLFILRWWSSSLRTWKQSKKFFPFLQPHLPKLCQCRGKALPRGHPATCSEDPVSCYLRDFIPAVIPLLSCTYFISSLWITSHTDMLK